VQQHNAIVQLMENRFVFCNELIDFNGAASDREERGGEWIFPDIE
jgi:hypothetical protein